MDLDRDKKTIQRITKKPDDEKKKPKKKLNQIFEMKKMELSKKDKEKLAEHSKLHKGGMKSKHMKNMVKFMKEGDSFSKAHNKAMKLDKTKKPKTVKKYGY